MLVFPPNDIVYISQSLPRWLNDWRKSHKSINYSGLCQEMLIQLIKEHDPVYYKQYEKLAENHIRRKETTPTPEIKIINV